jgi:hypothetical protein
MLLTDLIAAMQSAHIEHLVVEIEDDKISIEASREDRKAGGWDGRSKTSVSSQISRMDGRTLASLGIEPHQEVL